MPHLRLRLVDWIFVVKVIVGWIAATGSDRRYMHHIPDCSGVFCLLVESEWEVIADCMGGIGYDRPYMFRFGVTQKVSCTESLWVGLPQLEVTVGTCTID